MKMKLNTEQIISITLGAARIEENNGNVSFFRFTKEQEELYALRKKHHYTKTFSTSGIKLRFKTNSKTLKLDLSVAASTSRKFFSVDVTKDAKPIGHIDNITGVEVPKFYVDLDVPQGRFEKTFNIYKKGEEEHEICVYLPWSVTVTLNELSLDDGAWLVPIRPSKKMIAFGDSITHGYDAIRQYESYIVRLSEQLDAELYNKAIGGEVFFPELGATRDEFSPDYITVAYGTNDWACIKRSELEDNCRKFYKNVSENYPSAKIFALAPIWRSSWQDKKPAGEFREIVGIIKAATSELPNVTVIDCFGFVPGVEGMFSDRGLHPNKYGYAYYFEGLCNEIKRFV